MVVVVKTTRFRGIVRRKEDGLVVEIRGLYTGKALKKDFFETWSASGEYQPLYVERDGKGELTFEAPLFVKDEVKEEVNDNV